MELGEKFRKERNTSLTPNALIMTQSEDPGEDPTGPARRILGFVKDRNQM